MEHLIQVEILDNNNGGHKDIVFSIEGLTDRSEFDSYYFLVEMEPAIFGDIRNAVASLFRYWLIETRNIKEENPIYLPIDFSDEYTGCVQVIKNGNKLKLNYGFSRREGFAVNPLNPGDYSTTMNDFEVLSKKTLEVFYEAFISAIEDQIEHLSKLT